MGGLERIGLSTLNVLQAVQKLSYSFIYKKVRK